MTIAIRVRCWTVSSFNCPNIWLFQGCDRALKERERDRDHVHRKLDSHVRHVLKDRREESREQAPHARALGDALGRDKDVGKELGLQRKVGNNTESNEIENEKKKTGEKNRRDESQILFFII